MDHCESDAKEERRRNPMKRLAPVVAAMMGLSIVAGCKVGPSYHRPVVQPPTAYRDLSENPQVPAQAASYADLPWWQVFRDPQLQELIRIALKQNYDLQLQVTNETLKTQEDSVKLTKLRVDHGVVTKLDVLQAQQVLDSANAQIPDLERRIAQEENAISILLGNYPQGVPRGRPLVEQPLPPEVPPGMPSSLIERRPDIREAEQVLVSANAQIGVAKAQFFPQIALTGSGGGSFGRSSAFSSLMSSQVGIWSYGAQMSQPIFTRSEERRVGKECRSRYEPGDYKNN